MGSRKGVQADFLGAAVGVTKGAQLAVEAMCKAGRQARPKVDQVVSRKVDQRASPKEVPRVDQKVDRRASRKVDLVERLAPRLVTTRTAMG